MARELAAPVPFAFTHADAAATPAATPAATAATLPLLPLLCRYKVAVQQGGRTSLAVHPAAAYYLPGMVQRDYGEGDPSVSGSKAGGKSGGNNGAGGKDGAGGTVRRHQWRWRHSSGGKGAAKSNGAGGINGAGGKAGGINGAGGMAAKWRH
eukprot:gene15752-biopygen2429